MGTREAEELGPKYSQKIDWETEVGKRKRPKWSSQLLSRPKRTLTLMKGYEVTLEPISIKSFSRFSGSFEPIFDSFFRVNISFRILTLKKESKIGQNNPGN